MSAIAFALVFANDGPMLFFAAWTKTLVIRAVSCAFEASPSALATASSMPSGIWPRASLIFVTLLMFCSTMCLLMRTSSPKAAPCAKSAPVWARNRSATSLRMSQFTTRCSRPAFAASSAFFSAVFFAVSTLFCQLASGASSTGASPPSSSGEAGPGTSPLFCAGVSPFFCAATFFNALASTSIGILLQKLPTDCIAGWQLRKQYKE
mmetsp:Transcript_93473/g.270031  ORF Transcript_93473/g.270031 Transcript_93473/m.270031 type:complete len:207 (+) Transcript_93473:515-1135(+)